MDSHSSTTHYWKGCKTHIQMLLKGLIIHSTRQHCHTENIELYCFNTFVIPMSGLNNRVGEREKKRETESDPYTGVE